MLGSGDKRAQACEDSMVLAIRRSIAAARDLASGTTITAEDLMWVRPGSGLAPGQEQRLLGRKLTRAVPLGELIAAGDVD